MKPVKKVQSQGEARQIAIDWQAAQADQTISYGELAEAQDYFTKLAEKFDLVAEFRENGIA